MPGPLCGPQSVSLSNKRFWRFLGGVEGLWGYLESGS